MAERFVVDIVTEQVVEKLRAEAEQRIGPVVDAIAEEARRRLDEVISAAIPPIPEVPTVELEPVVVDPAADAKTDAKDRARRTLLQGAVVTVVVAGMLALAGAVGAPGFDFLDAGAWKTVVGTAFGAMLMAGASYVQRIINPPKSQ